MIKYQARIIKDGESYSVEFLDLPGCLLSNSGIITTNKIDVKYAMNGWELSYWRSHSQMEVDLCLGDQWAIEIKGVSRISPQHFKGLRDLEQEGLFKNYAVVCLEKHKRQVDGITIWPWEQFLSHLWEA